MIDDKCANCESHQRITLGEDDCLKCPYFYDMLLFHHDALWEDIANLPTYLYLLKEIKKVLEVLNNKKFLPTQIFHCHLDRLETLQTNVESYMQILDKTEEAT